jgi:predicted ATP-dependent serine protease
MLSLTSAVHAQATKAQPLPSVWPVLDEAGMKFRQSQLILIAGQPNSGKSLMALVYALDSKVDTLYFSADTDPITQLLRTSAHITKQNQSDVEATLDKDPHAYDPIIREYAGHIRWVFDPSPTLDVIELEILAYAEVYGVSPALVVVDNLMNAVAQQGEEWAGIRAIMSSLHEVARLTGSCVLALTHMSEQSDYLSNIPAPRRAIMGKASQLPAMILSIAMDTVMNELRVAAVKNRFGDHSADGKTFHSLYVNASRVQILDSSQIKPAPHWTEYYEDPNGQQVIAG